MSLRVATDSANVIKFVWGHPANEGVQSCTASRSAVSGCWETAGRRSLARLGSRSIIWADLHRTAASKVVYANPPDHPEMLVWQQIPRPGDLFVDVGANVGSYSVWAADLGADVMALKSRQRIPSNYWWRMPLSTATPFRGSGLQLAHLAALFSSLPDGIP